MAECTLSERSIFLEAIEMDAAERPAFLEQACGNDEKLRLNVEELLHAHQRFLETADSHPDQFPSQTDAVFERPGTDIGKYQLLEQIGEGGMGTVWMAQQQEPIKRRVAVKLIKPGMDSKQVLARFQAEQQALALMDHAHIAHVLDAGETAGGRPFFVMELVKGVPITQYANDNQLSPRERLELFVDVCQAVQHAHQKGIIHRDIKPSNVLVTLHDDKAVVKVIDFGIAKATKGQLTDKLHFTGHVHLIGTPLYMSPEQAQLSSLDVDTRSDVYSLGVLLYELLAGTTPFDEERLRKMGYDEMRRIIREEEPPRPSSRISTLGEGAAMVSEQRQSDPRRLSQVLRGELDWIVMKCLEKDRKLRYETASALAADVQRYLNDEPVQACPPSAWYRFRKFARRNKGAFFAVSAVAVAVLLAVGSLVGTVLVLTEEQKQTQAAKEALEETTYLQSIALAERQLSAGNVGRAEELLNGCPPRLRGWEWHFLKRQRYGNAPPLKHPDTVSRVAFSPDGRHIASGCLDGSVRIWDAQTRHVLHTLPYEAPIIRALAYSPDGQHLAAAHPDGIIRVWKAKTGKLLATLQGHQQHVWQVAFSPDGQVLASASQDRSVRLWDMGSKQANDADRLIRVLADHPAHVKGVAFTPDGTCVLAACHDGTVKTWNVASGRELSVFRHPLQNVDNACFSPDARRLAWSGQDGVIRVWDVATQKEVFAEQSNTGFGRFVAFSPDGRLIALAGFDGTVRLLDGATGREKLTIYAHPSHVSSVAFSPDGHWLVSASYDHTVRIWDATPLSKDPLAPHCISLTGHTDQVYAVAFSPDERWLASAGFDQTVKLWQLPGPGEPGAAITLRYTLRGHTGHIIGLAFSSDKQTLASASWDNTIKLWDLNTPQGDALAVQRTIPFKERILSIAFSPDGRLLAVGQRAGIHFCNPATGQATHPFKPTMAPVPALAFRPDGPHLISAGASDPCVKIWAIAGAKPIFEIRDYSNPNGTVAVSSDGKRIATPGRDQTVKVCDVDWEARTHKEVRTLKGHVGYVWRVAFSPDGRYLASGSWDSTIKVWDLEAPESAAPVTLRGHAGFIRSLAFSPDGKRLASASGYAGHGEVKVWDAILWENKANGKH